MRGIPLLAMSLIAAALAQAQEPDRYNPQYAYPDRSYDETSPMQPPEESPTYLPGPSVNGFDVQDPVVDVRYRITRVERATLNDLLNAWTGKPREVADTMIAKYGEPNEASAGRLVWHNNGLWKITILENADIPHDWPVPHTDMLYQAISYPVPLDKYDDLAMFDGSVLPERTRGWLGARCDKEEANFLAVNLANDIAQNKRSVREARDYYAKTVEAMMSGSMNDEQKRYTSTFTFPKSASMQGDKDRPHGTSGYSGGMDEPAYGAESYRSSAEMERIEKRKALDRKFKEIRRTNWEMEWEWTMDHPEDLWKHRDTDNDDEMP